MKILVGMHGQYGDQFICLPFIEHLKKQYPDCDITKLVNKRYQSVIPILKNCSYIDDFWISDDYEYWPYGEERDEFEWASFDMFFEAMPKHRQNDWFLHRHQTAEVFDMFGYKSPEEKYQINLDVGERARNQWIAFAPFAGYYNSNNNKKLSIEKAQDIVDYLRGLTDQVVQIGGSDEPKLKNVQKFDFSYYDSFFSISESKMFIHTDTGLGWAASGLKHKCLGLYSNEGYGDKIKNIQPVNPDAKYLDATNVNDISMKQISETIDQILK